VRVAGQSCLASPSVSEVSPGSGDVLALRMVRELYAESQAFYLLPTLLSLFLLLFPARCAHMTSDEMSLRAWIFTGFSRLR
jgi:hypothetical protein